MKLRAPYPYFGGKATVADLIWERLGDVANYVEPFFGSGAVLLNRPHYPFRETRIETINDADGLVCNFWRALHADPNEVAQHADWPVSELDLHARHLWLTNTGRQQVERLREDPDWYDAKIAGWWVWGIGQWIGSGWCKHPERKKLPHLGDAGMGVHRGSETDLHGYFRLLAERLRQVRVCCGDWSRVCGPTPTVKQGLTGVFLDPPYTQTERDANLYAVEINVAADVRQWCLEHGSDRRLRIALCGYAGECHEELEHHGWEVVAWKARGGYGVQGNGTDGRENSKRERIWFSPHCLNQPELSLFA